MEPGTFVLIIVAVVVIWLALDLLLAGDGMTSGMMGGMAGMMGSGVGPLLLLLLAFIALLLYGLFCRCRLLPNPYRRFTLASQSAVRLEPVRQ